jgi:catechol 2,3-dioxygenase-like lactoylglutathione lyase family enzyme
MDKGFSQFGPVMQLAFVPKDIHAALRHWTETMGAGPFFKFPHIPYAHFGYRGAAQNVDFTVYTAYWGDLQIELIEQHNAAPSTYQEWLDAGHEGLHHICIAVDDLAPVRAYCAGVGAEVLQEMRMDGLETIYADGGGGPGSIVEFARISPQFLGAFAAIRQAAQGWDGTDPVRMLG